MSALTTRRDALAELVPTGLWPVVDVGADHGLLAERIGAIATELRPNRRSQRAVPWVICDGLRPFRTVGCAVIAGMGWRTIARVLDDGPAPTVAVLHADDDPGALRRWLASHGWRIDAERLGAERQRVVCVVRAVRGVETATDLPLHFGPRLLDARSDPLLERYVSEQWAGARAHLRRTRGATDSIRAEASRWLAFLEDVRALVAGPPVG